MNEQDKTEIIEDLIDLIIQTDNAEKCKNLFDVLLTGSELLSIAQRLSCAKLLNEGFSYSDIVRKIDIGPYIISKIQAQLPQFSDYFMEDTKKYVSFAKIYDKLTGDVDYKSRTRYVKQIFDKYNFSPKLILDLACGTGNITTLMAMDGYDMIGVDISAEMLSQAMEKSTENDLNILYLNQPMEEFELYGTVDCVLCLLDSINYLTEHEDLEHTFELVHNYLNPEGLFIFDINTKYKFENVLAGNVFCGRDDNNDVFYNWENVYDPEQEICEFILEFFIKDGAKYTRSTEYHYEKAYCENELAGLLVKSGFEVLGIFDDLSFSPTFAQSEKVFFVARKKPLSSNIIIERNDC